MPCLFAAYLLKTKTDPATGQSSKIKVSLNSGDAIFNEIRNVAQHEVGGILHAKSSEIQKFHQVSLI